MKNSQILFGAILLSVWVSNLAATDLPRPISYAKPTKDGLHVLVVFGDAEAEAALSDSDMKKKAEEVRQQYPKAGLYRLGDPSNPEYELSGYAPDENIFLTDDGACVARLEGEWWRTKAYPAGTRLAAEVEQEQLNAPAVSFYLRGILQKQYLLKDILVDPSEITHSPEHILWPGGAVLNDDNQFILFTQDSNRLIFNIFTGELISRERMGVGNRFGQITILATLSLTVLVAVVWLRFFLRRKKDE